MANNLLLDLLKEPEFASSLAYLVVYKNHENIRVTAKEHSIVLANEDITIAVIIYAGFEQKEYAELKKRSNVNFISLSPLVPTMVEFKNMNIKYVDKMAWLFSVISRSKNSLVEKLNSLKSLQLD